MVQQSELTSSICVCTQQSNTQEWEEQMRLKYNVLGHIFWSIQQLNVLFIAMQIVYAAMGTYKSFTDT
jgi:hypothetical protein